MKVLQFRKFIRIHWLLLGLLLIAAAFFLKPENTVTAQLGEQSFFTPQTWAHDLTQEQGWRPEHPRLLADINGDHHQDVVGFGNDGTWGRNRKRIELYSEPRARRLRFSRGRLACKPARAHRRRR
jgi:hypothetical protein